MPERWSVEIERHEPRGDQGYENSVQELKVYLTLEQVGLVRKAILTTLANNEATTFLAKVGADA